jgi:uncharacterized membrane protein
MERIMNDDSTNLGVPRAGDELAGLPHTAGTKARSAPDRALTRTMWSVLPVLVLLVLVYAAIRVATDWPHVLAGTRPDDDSFESRYVRDPALAYAHIIPGVVYLVGAPLQLSRRFRERHFTVHRRMGRVVLPAGIVAGVFAIIFGTLFSFGGFFEASATIIFGHFFVAALITAYLAIRRGDVDTHRRWMIRAFAVGLAVGTIRVWQELFMGLGLLSFENSFPVSFWLAFTLHALAAEAYLRRRPSAQALANA